MRQVFPLRPGQHKRLVRQLSGKNRIFVDFVVNMPDFLSLRHQAFPDRRQRIQQLTIAIALLVLLRLERRQRFFYPGEIGEQVVEAAVFGVNHHHILHIAPQQRVLCTLRQSV
ncbi:hypothetical protein D3C71_1841780 [compost metagenome]